MNGQPVHGGWRAAAAYGLLGAPLAMAALPLFVQLPAYYATHVGVALAPLGGLLFAARLLDMLQDPLLGHLLDRAGTRRRRWLLPAALLLGGAFAALWLPPAGVAPALWLPLMLVLAYGAHSLLSIAYLAWGAQLPASVAIGGVAWREAAGLAGMLLASVIPAAILNGQHPQVRTQLGLYCAGYAGLLLLALATLLRLAPAATPQPAAQGWRATLRSLAGTPAVRALLLPYFINALSVALPATLALFFIADQLQAAPLGGAFLASYFAAAACGLPAWTRLARRYGALACWRGGMLLSVLGFAGAALLGPGDTTAYLLVCLAAGAALGADLTLPPLLLAQALGRHAGAGAAFGMFTLLGKLALAVSGLALPLLAALGYQPGNGAGPALALTYAGLPCALKLLAMLALWRYPAAPSAVPSGSLT